jgi:hypothetical protein
MWLKQQLDNFNAQQQQNGSNVSVVFENGPICIKVSNWEQLTLTQQNNVTTALNNREFYFDHDQ